MEKEEKKEKKEEEEEEKYLKILKHMNLSYPGKEKSGNSFIC